ncbi:MULTISPECIES: thioesterase II family protein [Alteromonas]|jgi:surfactin synthase thioesterase subunit|nr:thioesterase [Alteromonas stellipolaris LMG 21856]
MMNMKNSLLKSTEPRLLKPVVENASAPYQLICFPCAGGNASMFQSWADFLGADIELLGLHAPGRGARFAEPAFDNMDALVNCLLDEADVLERKPYILLGHSLGARVAYEFAKRATQLGYPAPLHFIASGSRAPNGPKVSSPTHSLPSSEFMNTILEMGGIPDEVRESQEMLHLLEPTFRADFKIAEQYTSTAIPLDCPITAICGDEDYKVPEGLVKKWGSFTTSSWCVRCFSGGHFFINQNPHVIPEISRLIVRCFALFTKPKMDMVS